MANDHRAADLSPADLLAQLRQVDPGDSVCMGALLCARPAGHTGRCLEYDEYEAMLTSQIGEAA